MKVRNFDDEEKPSLEQVFSVEACGQFELYDLAATCTSNLDKLGLHIYGHVRETQLLHIK